MLSEEEAKDPLRLSRSRSPTHQALGLQDADAHVVDGFLGRVQLVEDLLLAARSPQGGRDLDGPDVVLAGAGQDGVPVGLGVLGAAAEVDAAAHAGETFPSLEGAACGLC